MPNWPPRKLRIGITGLARSGKTALLTSLAANLLALGQGGAVLPALRTRLGTRTLRVTTAPAGAAGLPRFDAARHLAALAADPPRWPARTQSVSLLALDLEIGRSRLGLNLPPRRLRLELLDYPGEWLLDLPLLGQDYAAWSEATLRRLADHAPAQRFLAFASGLPAEAPGDEALAEAGHLLYVACLTEMQASGLSFLQPGRFLMPPPGPMPPWMAFFPSRGRGGLQRLLARRYEALREAVREDLSAPLFGRLDRLVVLADLLSSLHAGAAAFADAEASLAAASAALSGAPGWAAFLPQPVATWFRTGGIGRVAFAATKADHVAERQRGNLARLLQTLSSPIQASRRRSVGHFAIAAVRCTEDFVWTLEGHPVSAVRGRVLGDDRLTRSYPGEVPDQAPTDGFWTHKFLALPDFEPARAGEVGRPGVPEWGLDRLLCFLLEDVL